MINEVVKESKQKIIAGIPKLLKLKDFVLTNNTEGFKEVLTIVNDFKYDDLIDDKVVFGFTKFRGVKNHYSFKLFQGNQFNFEGIFTHAESIRSIPTIQYSDFHDSIS